ncbi:hypothetical protein [Streptomyces sp. Root1310]|uniref:hypothetical protein n=1 Tax=Streptomyces sp. Root1310 TaxID=1736452 RepID=UPI00070C8194|nr:hypothetical protein [Streptomyces sp. Root1310]KQX80686.1 hypothetical protein ASD48_32140 [Streptomyces sp. Root1310]
METETDRPSRPPRSPQPPGVPRWVAMFYDPASTSWRPGAESPDRTPVLYAIGEMTQVKRARGDEVAVDLWGPKDGEWRRYDPSPSSSPALTPSLTPSSSPAGSVPEAAQPSGDGGARPGHAKLAERMEDRRHQVIMAGLGKAGLYDLAPEDVTAVRTLVDQVDEATLRRVAHWMALAGRPVE